MQPLLDRYDSWVVMRQEFIGFVDASLARGFYGQFNRPFVQNIRSAQLAAQVEVEAARVRWAAALDTEGVVDAADIPSRDRP